MGVALLGAALLGGCPGRAPVLEAGAARDDAGPCDPCDAGGPDPTDGGAPDAGEASDGGEALDGGCGCVEVERLFPSDPTAAVRHPACHLASPLAFEGAAGIEVLSPVDDAILGLDPLTGEELWRVVLPAPDGEQAFVVATPLLLPSAGGDRLVVGYHTTDAIAGRREVLNARHRHRVAVVDPAARALDPAFDVVELAGEHPSADPDAGPVVFEPAQALGRAALVGARLPGDALGKVYVTFGNALDLQPWHGFAFEIDLDAWLASGPDAATTGFFVDTPETDCGPRGRSGSRQRVCGGGLWAPSGPLVVDVDGGYEVVLASGNGQLDLTRRDYANTLMRAGPGLHFDDGCDPEACAGFDPDLPHEACIASCANLFVPRMPPGEDFTALVSGDRCAGMSMFECWAVLDYVGGSTPVRVSVEGFDLLVSPTKDGAVYLVDADHLGAMHERRQLVPICGTETSACTMDWAGMIVTQPAKTTLDGAPLVLVPTFMADGEQEAGVFALKVVVVDGAPSLEEVWRFPAAGTPEARARFRVHPSRIALARLADGREAAVLVEPRPFGAGFGRLLVLDVRTGALLADAPLAGRGVRFALPLVVDDRIYVPSCESNAGDGWLEGFRLRTP